jgi:hypothetical protein
MKVEYKNTNQKEKGFRNTSKEMDYQIHGAGQKKKRKRGKKKEAFKLKDMGNAIIT